MNDTISRSTSVGQVETLSMSIALPDGGLRLKNGGVLPELTVAYETYGRMSPDSDNVVYICHALTGDAHVAGYHAEDDKTRGWWDEMVGPGKGIDTDYYHVICANILGGCKGTTGPCSTDPRTGKPYGAAFPEITVEDIVKVQRLLLGQLGIQRLAAVIGGSFGGMQVLEWGIRYPEMVDRCICVASGSSLSAQALAFDVVAGDAIKSDREWFGGDYWAHGTKPVWGLAHARKIGHITYLSPEIMETKFGRQKTSVTGHGGKALSVFQVESYLQHQGQKLVDRFDANSYLRIAGAMDSFDLEEEFGSLEKAFAGVKAKFLVVALSSDWLFPPEQSQELATSLIRTGKSVAFCTLKAPYGHDAFLVDIEHMADTIRAFLPWVSGDRKQGELSVTVTEAHAEYGLVAGMIQPGSRVLDCGCGNGELLSVLSERRQVRGVGLDIDLDNVIQVIERGHDVFQEDMDQGLAPIPDGAYDYAVLSGTLQVVRKPRLLLREMLRVAREAIVTFPNFANWLNRIRLGFGGRMPVSEELPFRWYDTPNIHLTTMKDFSDLCAEDGIDILEKIAVPRNGTDRLFLAMGMDNLGAQRILVRLRKRGAQTSG